MRLLAAILALAFIGAPALADVLMGHARVVDGDTIEVAGQRIRLHGIDAPESGQSCERSGVTWYCGIIASAKLRELVGTGDVECQERDHDQYGRIVAVCRVGDVDINAEMVTTGLALAYRRYSEDYVGQEAAAQAAGRGLWSGSFVAPWDWRQGKRSVFRAANDNRAPPASVSCDIKGNISVKTGERIYHVPGGEYYDATVINPAKGERMFCSEEEARAAGWRRSKR